MSIRHIIIKILQRMIRLLSKKGGSTGRYAIGNTTEHNTMIDSLSPQFIKIGDNFISAPHSQISAHDASYFIFTQKYRIEPVIIGDDVFLGMGAIVLPGVKIGHRVVIGAGSVVTRDIPDNSVAVGNPARVICTVDEYIAKAEQRGSLYDAPFTLKDIEGRRLTPEEVEDFQRRADNE